MYRYRKRAVEKRGIERREIIKQVSKRTRGKEIKSHRQKRGEELSLSQSGVI